MLLALGNSLGDFDPNMLSTHLLAAPRRVALAGSHDLMLVRVAWAPLPTAPLAPPRPQQPARDRLDHRHGCYGHLHDHLAEGGLHGRRGHARHRLRGHLRLRQEQALLQASTQRVASTERLVGPEPSHQRHRDPPKTLPASARRVHVNAGSVGLLSALAWVGLTVLVLGLVSHPVPGVTIAMAAGAPVAYVLGHLAMRRRAIQRSSGLWQRVCGGFDSHNLNGFAQEDAFKLLQRPADVEVGGVRPCFCTCASAVRHGTPPRPLAPPSADLRARCAHPGRVWQLRPEQAGLRGRGAQVRPPILPGQRLPRPAVRQLPQVCAHLTGARSLSGNGASVSLPCLCAPTC